VTLEGHCLSHVSSLTHDIDTEVLSVRLLCSSILWKRLDILS